MTTTDIAAWPALDLLGQQLPSELPYQRAVWGKVHGAATDYRWIAATGSFAQGQQGVERQLVLGTEDAPHKSQHWRTTGGVHYALQCYPSRAVDAAGRSGLLEKQVLEWRREPAVPAVLGSLALLPWIADWTDEVWWPARGEPRLLESDFTLELDAATCPPVPVSAEAVARAIASGIEQLQQLVSVEVLGELYARLLSGQRGVPLGGLEAPLAPEALAALALPLPRKLADRLSLAGWLPSTRVDPAALADSWDLVAAGDPDLVPAGDTAPDPGRLRRGLRMAKALFDRDPGRLDASAAKFVDASGEPPVQLALWGPSAAGKTVLLAQLYLYIEKAGSAEDAPADRKVAAWKILPTRKSRKFIDKMRDQMYRKNLFPPPTAVGGSERIVYNFRNVETGVKAALAVEDRAGVDFESLQKDAQERLRQAEGLVLLFDPTRDRTQLEIEVARTLEEVHVESDRDGDLDDRPIAVCISKADVLIHSPSDLDRARSDPDGFVRERVDPILVDVLERFCSNYQLFPVSAAGVRVRHGVVEPTVFFDESLTPRIGRTGRPFNLMAPFAWALDQISGS